MFDPQRQAKQLAEGVLNRERGEEAWDACVNAIAEALQAARVYGRNEVYDSKDQANP